MWQPGSWRCGASPCLLPAAKVVAGYGDTSRDNGLVITQEWNAEAMTMWLIAAIVVSRHWPGRFSAGPGRLDLPDLHRHLSRSQR